MKRFILLTLVFFVMVMAGPVMALDTSTLTVNSNVVGTCTFDTTAATLDFGDLNADTALEVLTSTTADFWCSSGVAFTVTNNDGQNFTTTPRMFDGVADYIPYTIAHAGTDTGTGGGIADTKTLQINGTIAAASYTGVPTGAYTDELEFTISP